jgi:hypothetical protein
MSQTPTTQPTAAELDRLRTARHDREFIESLARWMPSSLEENPNDRTTAIWLRHIKQHLADFPINPNP